MAGTFRSGRHPKLTVTGPKTRPVKPSGLRQDASEFWDASISECEHLSEQDTALCVLACDLYVLLQDTMEAAKSDPVDRETRIAAVSYAERFGRAVAQLGIDPIGRMRIKPDASGREEDPLAEFGVVG